MSTACVITISTAAASGTRQDTSGKLLRDGLVSMNLAVREGGIIPDDILRIQQAVLRYCDFEPVSLLAFTGGTGPTPDDVTPQALEPLLDRRYAGIETAIHDDGRVATARAPVSRLVIGSRGRTVVAALPGSPGAVEDAIRCLAPMLTHLLALASGRHDPH